MNKYKLLKYLFVVVAILFVAELAYFGFGKGKNSTASSVNNSSASSVNNSQALSVQDIQADPTAYTGTITIIGTMAGVDPNNSKVFGLIDTAEAVACKSTGCANFYLPVKYEGTLPKDWDEVKVTGKFVDGGKLFEASKVDVVRHLNL